MCVARYAVFLLILLSSPVKIFAQLRIGAELTAGAAGVREPFLSAQEPVFFAGFGACADYAPVRWFSLAGGLRLLPRGWQTSAAAADLKTRVRYYNIALPMAIKLLSGQGRQKTYLMLGASFEINGWNRVKIAGSDSQALPSSLDISPLDYALQGGFGRQIAISQRYGIEIELGASYMPRNTFFNGGLTLRLLRTLAK